jgi:hypothetical protein
MRVFRVALIAAAAALAVAAACSKENEVSDSTALGEYVETKNDSFPKIRYFETNLVSINDRCAVRKTKLNLKMQPVYVNGQPVGFC